MNEANASHKPETAGWPGRVDRLVGRASFLMPSCLVELPPPGQHPLGGAEVERLFVDVNAIAGLVEHQKEVGCTIVFAGGGKMSVGCRAADIMRHFPETPFLTLATISLSPSVT